MEDTKSLTISQIVKGLPRLKHLDAELEAFETSHPFTPNYEIVDKSTYLGIEVEVENVTAFDRSGTPYWTMVPDGSLRNHGQEFVSHPIRAYRAEQALTTLFDSLNSTIDFSERTSIHIHMNIRTLNVEQLEAMIFLYLVFEKALFSYVGENRYENIFCVPLCETNLGVQLKTLFDRKQIQLDWCKYTALNLIPITEKGTIEFRQLHGTRDIEKIIGWINLILCLKRFALRYTPEYIKEKISTLNTSSEYMIFGGTVFGTHLYKISKDNYEENVSENVSFIKEQCFNNRFENPLNRLIEEEENSMELTFGETAINPISPALVGRDIFTNTSASRFFTTTPNINVNNNGVRTATQELLNRQEMTLNDIPVNIAPPITMDEWITRRPTVAPRPVARRP